MNEEPSATYKLELKGSDDELVMWFMCPVMCFVDI